MYKKISNRLDSIGSRSALIGLLLMLGLNQVQAQLPNGVVFFNHELNAGPLPAKKTAPFDWQMDQGEVSIDDIDAVIEAVNTGYPATYEWVDKPSSLFPANVRNIIAGVSEIDPLNVSKNRATSFTTTISGLEPGAIYNYSFLATGNRYKRVADTGADPGCQDIKSLKMAFIFDGAVVATSDLEVGAPARTHNFTFQAPAASGRIIIGLYGDAKDCSGKNPWYNIAAGSGRFTKLQGPCVAPKAKVNFDVSGDNKTLGYNTIFALTDQDDNIISSHIEAPIEVPSADGKYRIYAVNFRLFVGDMTPNLRAGLKMSEINGSCVAVSAPLEVCVDRAMPVVLISFDAKREGKTAYLNWSTAEEINADRFDIERSADGKSWAPIGLIAARGESKTRSDYHFLDPKQLDPTTYYRLKMIDKDETFAYSSIRKVSFEDAFKQHFLFPNPASDVVYVANLVPEKVKVISILNNSGQVLFRAFSQFDKGISVKNLKPGIYNLNVENMDGTSAVRRLLISR